MADVFISYRRAERQRVELLERLLRDENFSVWFDARLDVGRGEGFDAEIEREVTCASSVLVCWTPEAIKSVYVRAEAKKGLEREVLVPVFLQECSLPVPFNDVDAADLSAWDGDPEDENWLRVTRKLRRLKDQADENREALIASSAAAYGAIEQAVYPGALRLLIQKIAALHELDALRYEDDIDSLLTWLEATFKKESEYMKVGYERAVSRPGETGGPWRYWEGGGAEARSERIAAIRRRLEIMGKALATTQGWLSRSLP